MTYGDRVGYGWLGSRVAARGEIRLVVRRATLLGERDARTQRPARIKPRLDRGRARTQRDPQRARR